MLKSTRERSMQSNENDGAVRTYSPYKFVIAMENDFSNGYWVEKMINPILARSIPIYGGVSPEPWIARYINPSRFIYCQFDDSKYSAGGFDQNNPEKRLEDVLARQRPALEKCIEQIKRVHHAPLTSHWFGVVAAPRTRTWAHSVFKIVAS